MTHEHTYPLDPFEYQWEGAKFLSERRRALLLDDPGTGKTLQAIIAKDILGAETMDTICPASVTKQWETVHAELAQTDTDFNAYSYERARDKGISANPEVLDIDELHYCSNVSSGRTVKILGQQKYGVDGLINSAGYVWGMTGTLLTRDPSTLYPAMLTIIPGSLYSRTMGRSMDEWQFLKRYCHMYDTGYGMKVTGGKNLEELRDRLAPFVLRRTKKDVRKDWKKPVVGELWLDPGEAADLMMKADLEPEGRAVAEAFKRGGFDALEQFADTERTGSSRYRRYVGLLKVLPVTKWLLDEFDQGLHKIFIAAVHREVIESLAEKLQEQGIQAFIYYGGMTDKAKDAAKKGFINSKQRGAFIGQIDSVGTGTDGIQKATGRLLYVEWSWLGHVNQQTLDRLDRIGQEEPVLGQFASFADCIDGNVMRTAVKRTRMAATLFGEA